MKKFFTALFFIMLVITIASFILFGIYFFDNKDYCLDSSICKEGLKVNTEYGLIKVNKENCLKHNWIWDEKNKFCNMK